MPRRKSALVRQYFNYNKDRDSSQCMANTGDTTEVNYGIEGKHSQQCRKTLTVFESISQYSFYKYGTIIRLIFLYRVTK